MHKKIRILIADDDSHVLASLSRELISTGYEVITASSGLEALDQAQAQEPDLLILDIMMPRMDSLQTLAKLRQYSNTPVIILSNQNSYASKIKGLNTGADDYLVKPFNNAELDARIKAVLRRAYSLNRNDVLHFENISIDFNRQYVLVNNEVVQLTLIEWQLLGELANNAGHLIQYELLLTKVWGPEYHDDVKLLRTWISRLRQKLENHSDHRLIHTVRDTGYIMELPVPLKVK
jgi:DNA-binding response OmpR family regulator